MNKWNASEGFQGRPEVFLQVTLVEELLQDIYRCRMGTFSMYSKCYFIPYGLTFTINFPIMRPAWTSSLVLQCPLVLHQCFTVGTGEIEKNAIHVFKLLGTQAIYSLYYAFIYIQNIYKYTLIFKYREPSKILEVMSFVLDVLSSQDDAYCIWTIGLCTLCVERLFHHFLSWKNTDTKCYQLHIPVSFDSYNIKNRAFCLQ